jgi:hypothetical protein
MEGRHMASKYRTDHKEVLDELLLVMPGVTGGKAFGYPAYKFGKKIFCFVGSSGVTIKLPEVRVAELIAENPGEMHIFSPADGYLWKGWLLIDRDDSEDFHQDRGLFDEAVAYVSGG